MKKLFEVLDGHKTQIGLVLTALPDVLNNLAAAASSLLPVLQGAHMEGTAAAVLHFTGGVAVVIGFVHKLQKIASDYLK